MTLKRKVLNEMCKLNLNTKIRKYDMISRRTTLNNNPNDVKVIN